MTRIRTRPARRGDTRIAPAPTVSRAALPLVAALVLAATAAGARAAPIDDRDAAFRALGEAARVERAQSNCRWIRGRGDAGGLAAWRRDNGEILASALAVVRAQGGYTPERRRVAEELTAAEAEPASASRAACEAFQAEVRTGAHDLGARLAVPTIRAILGYAPPQGAPAVWRVELRRGADGVLRRGAVRDPGPDVAACDADRGAGLGHVQVPSLSGAPPDPRRDPDLWFSECMQSPVDPLTGAPPPRAQAGDGP